MTQDCALQILKTGANVFLTGEPGSGKTYVINQYIAWLEAARIPVAVTASTGIAATHIGGMTIHSWSWIGARDSLSPYDIDAIASKEKVAKRIQKARVLVIDEISMLDGSVIDMVDRVCRTIRGSGEAFGGLQVICVGDFFQLPPVTRNGDMMRYAFESRAWDDAHPLVCYLTEQYRQEDELLLSLLKSIRKNEVEEEHFTLLGEQQDITYENIKPTKLYTHNVDVDAVNTAELNILSGNTRTYTMTEQGNKQLLQGLVKNCLSPATLALKEDALVMCTKNNFDMGFVNGTLATVVGFNTDDGYPIIKTTEGKELTMKPMSWDVSEDGKVLAEISQIPLRLAWAITVHKSQGMSLDAAEIDLSRAFVFGQGYVALSRVRSLGGLKMIGMSPTALRVDPKIVAHDERFRTESTLAEETFAGLPQEELITMQKRFVSSMGGTFPKEGTVTEKKKGYERIRKESTYEITRTLLVEGKSIAAIAKERNMNTSTIWSHVEKLAEEGKITLSDVQRIVPENSDWDDFYRRVCEAIKKHTPDRLKPLFEALNEKYDYEYIRLGRLYYVLSTNGDK